MAPDEQLGQISDPELGDRRLQSWTEQPPFGGELYFNWLLEQKDLTRDEFLQALSLNAEELAGISQPPEWMRAIQRAYDDSRVEPYVPGPGEEELGFLNLVDPLIEHALFSLRATIDEMIERYDSTPINRDNIIDIFVDNLPGQLIQRMGRTMALELNVMRLMEQLEGETSQERFISFVRKLRDPDVAGAMFDEYPVLIRQLAICINQWIYVSDEFLRRVCDDYELLIQTLSPDEHPGALVRVAAGAGDTHRRGRTVMIAIFESGLRVAYKPKSLAIDIHFQNLLDWLNDAGCDPPLRTFVTLDREEYGWAEFVTRADCTTKDEVRRFYRRQGSYLALMYVLAANDFHYENVIASGEDPMLIDLETMLQPLFDRFDVTSADSLLAQRISNSVLTIGLLPMRIWSFADNPGIDISGLGGASGQLTPDRIPGAADAGTDAMRYVREQVEIVGDANRPVLDGVESNAIDYIEDIVGGFEMMYQLIHEYRDELLSESGLINAFANDSIRVLMRPTRTYGQLIFESFHPDMLRDAIDRERFLDRMWYVAPSRTYMRGVIKSELDDIMRGDIPVFTSFPASFDLYDAMDRPIPDVLIERGIDNVRERILAMNQADMDQQVWHIRASIATISSEESTIGGNTYKLLPSPLRTPQLREHVRRCADYLCDNAITMDDEGAWIGLQPLAEELWSIGTLAIDLHSGTPGVALFLAYAAEVLGESRYEDVARLAYTSTQRRAEYMADQIIAVGAYEGWGGLVHAFLHLGELWDDDEIRFQTDRMANRIWGFVEEDVQYGIVRGSAGAIQSLLTLNSIRYADSRQAIANLCGERLLEQMQMQDRGAGWVIERFGEQPLTGYAHGSAGIGMALARLYGVTKDDRYIDAARNAFEYERGRFNSTAQNWPDLRTSGDYDKPRAVDDSGHRVAWCHGAGGIALSRMLALPIMDDDALEMEATTALDIIVQRGFGQTHCLCHGDLGNLDILVLAAQQEQWKQYNMLISDRLGQIVDSIERSGWQCGGPNKVTVPGMMLGVAGIGYQLLRMAEPERVPSVLALEPPRNA